MRLIKSSVHNVAARGTAGIQTVRKSKLDHAAYMTDLLSFEIIREDMEKDGGYSVILPPSVDPVQLLP